jgi:hypothetical protein
LLISVPYKINIACTGPIDARPVVIFEAGGGGTSAAWKGVHAALPATICTCVYVTAPARARATPARNLAAWTRKLSIFICRIWEIWATAYKRVIEKANRAGRPSRYVLSRYLTGGRVK